MEATWAEVALPPKDVLKALWSMVLKDCWSLTPPPNQLLPVSSSVSGSEMLAS
ncbi:hypothetical protein [Microvirga tunisiensis]|uniref:hypothetical protein n=1 Tax=Microvirga tunisiensis TaxID=2108360 RepID=UPI00129CAF06|nr:hypothetical protein [Microvirga tunisiensis]